MLLSCVYLMLMASVACYAYKMPLMPAGTYLIDKTGFLWKSPTNADMPICRGQEPCGYYSFDPATRRPLKWIPSWCRCKQDQDCVYSGRNNKMRIYTHACLDSSMENSALIE